MTAIKLLSAGLIAAAMFTMPADAHGKSPAQRNLLMKGNVLSSGRWAYSNVRIPTPNVVEFAIPPFHERGGVCDSGDDGMIC